MWSQPSQAQSFPAAYDAEIRAATAKWWPDLPFWRLWKAQLFQESKLDPAAVSPVGARGLAQFMPKTWGEMRLRCGLSPLASPHDPEPAIQAGACYMKYLRGMWKRDRQVIDRHWLAAASYNRGTGNIIKDQARCGDALLWDDIAPCTATVTTETVIYVTRIRNYWRLLEAK